MQAESNASMQAKSNDSMQATVLSVQQVHAKMKAIRTLEEVKQEFMIYASTRDFIMHKSMQRDINHANESDEFLILYVEYLIAQGNVSEAIQFVEDHADKADYIMNHPSLIRFGGNILHSSLFWNNGEKGLCLFLYFYGKGAKIMLDDYDCVPWQQTYTYWIYPTNGFIGTRDVSEFNEVYGQVARYMAFKQKAK